MNCITCPKPATLPVGVSCTVLWSSSGSPDGLTRGPVSWWFGSRRVSARFRAGRPDPTSNWTENICALVAERPLPPCRTPANVPPPSPTGTSARSVIGTLVREPPLASSTRLAARSPATSGVVTPTVNRPVWPGPRTRLAGDTRPNGSKTELDNANWTVPW